MVGEKFGNLISCVGNSLLNMTLLASCRVSISSFRSLTFLGWSIHFCLPFDLCCVIMTTDPMDPKAAKLPVVSLICSRVVLLQLHLPLILCTIQKQFCIPLSHVDDVGYIMALLQHGHFLSTSAHYLGICLRDSLPVP